MSEIILKAKRNWKFNLFLVACATLVLGLPFVEFNQRAEASNPLLNSTFKVQFSNDSSTQQGSGAEGKDYYYNGSPNDPLTFTLCPVGPVPAGTPTVEINGAANGDASVTISGGNIVVTLNNPGSHRQNGKIEITVVYPDGSCWHGYITIIDVTKWKVTQKTPGYDSSGNATDIEQQCYDNGETIPLSPTEGGSYKLSASFDTGTPAEAGNYEMALVGIADQQPIVIPPGVKQADFEFCIPTFALGGGQMALVLRDATTKEVLCRTVVTPGSYDLDEKWTYTYQNDTPTSTPYKEKKCAPCSITSTSNETDRQLKPESGEECAAGYTDFGANSDDKIDVETSAGSDGNGRGGGGLRTGLDNIGGSAAGGESGGPLPSGQDPANPASLRYVGTDGPRVTLDSTGSYPATVETATGKLAVENVVSNGYTLNFYKPAATQPETCLIVRRPTTLEPDGSQALRYIEQRFSHTGTGSIVETRYTQKANGDGSSTWIIYKGSELATKTSTPRVTSLAADTSAAAFIQKTRIDVSTIENGIQTQTITVSERRADTGAWEETSKVENTYRHYVWGNPIVGQVSAPGGKALTKSWEYVDTDHQGYRRGMVKKYTDHQGYWRENEWDEFGRLTKVKEPFLNVPEGSPDNQSKVTRFGFDDDANQGAAKPIADRTEDVEINGMPVSRRKVHGTLGDRSKDCLNAGGQVVRSTRIQRAPVQALVNDPLHNYAANSYEVELVVYPDGTRHSCAWSYSGASRIRDCKQGNLALDRGTRTVTTFDSIGNAVNVENRVLDFNNTAGNDQLLSTVARTNLDGLGRPLTTTTTFADGSPAQVSSILYGCCGIRSTTDIRGVVTTYHHDHLKRLETAESLGVVRATQYNGLTRRSLRIPAGVAPTDSHGHYSVRGTQFDGSNTGQAVAMVTGENEYNLEGEHIRSSSPSPRNADGHTLEDTTYAYTYGEGTTVGVDYPDFGRAVTTYSRDGRVISVTGSAVNHMTYEYGPSLPGVTFGNGAVFGTKVIQANGTQWTASTTDLCGRPVETHFADGAKATMHYNALNQLERSVDPDGVTTLYAYNDEGERTTRAADLDGDNTINNAVDRVSFSETNVTTGHNGSTHVWETVSRVYGTSGGSLNTGKSQRSVDGLKSWSVPFEINDRATSSVTVLSGSGNWTSTSVVPGLDASNNRVDGLTSVATYTGGLLRTSVTRGADSVETTNSTNYFYDAHNRTDKTTDARTGDTTVVFLNNDQQSAVTQVRAGANSLTTGFTYDAMGRTLITDAPDSTGQDTNGSPVTLTNVVTRTYDKRGNVLTVDGDQTYRRDYTYDDLSRLTTLKTFGTQTSITTWNYNTQRGWLDNKKYPDVNNPLQQGLGTTYSYTAGGRLKGRGWARGVNTTWHYDFEGNDTGFGANAKAGDLQGVTYSDGTPYVAYSYRKWGAIAAISDVTGNRTFAYRETIDLALLNEVTSSSASSQQEVSIPRTMTRAYDNLGRTTSGTLSGSSGTDHVTAYDYDEKTGRLSTITHGNAAAGIPEAPFTCAYVQNSNLPSTTTGPAHKVSNSYESHRDVLKTNTNTDKQGTPATISAITYGTATDAVNGIGQREDATRSSSATYNAVTNTENWKYDDKGQVVLANHSVNAKDRSYAFDGIGNRTRSTSGSNPAVISNPNALNQLDNVGGTARSHDPDGNLEDDGTKLYSWDAENRLVMVQRKSDNAVISEYRYDYMSRRVYKETTANASQGAGVTLFHYEGWNLCAEYNATAISGTAPSITPAAIVSIQRTYTWGMDLSGSMQGAGGVGGLLVIEEKQGVHAGKYYPLYDGNGNVTELVKIGGATGTTLVAHYEYDPFGQLTQNDDSDGTGYNAVNPFRFSTKYFDEEVEFYYYGYRYYDSAVGRWLSRDPIEERGGYNLYAFVNNDGVNDGDYLGLARGITCVHYIHVGHTTENLADMAFQKMRKLTYKPLDISSWLSCAHGLPKGHRNLWPDAKSRAKHWNRKYKPTDTAVKKGLKKAGDRVYPSAKKDDPILGDLLEPLIKKAEKNAPKLCGKSHKPLLSRSEIKCNKIKIEVKLSDSPSMTYAMKVDRRVKNAYGYWNVYDCKSKKWSKKMYRGSGQL